MCRFIERFRSPQSKNALWPFSVPLAFLPYCLLIRPPHYVADAEIGGCLTRLVEASR
jgi:hypothetical protein